MRKIQLFKKFNVAVLMVNKSSLSYHDHLHDLTLEFPEDAVRDLEVINEDVYRAAIDAFITTNELAPQHLLVALNMSLFFKKIFKDQADLEAKRNTFLENVPFEHIASKVPPGEKELTLLATNQDYFMPFKTAFERKGCAVSLVIPALALDKYSLDIKDKIDAKTTKAIQKKFKALQQYNLLNDRTNSREKKEQEKSVSKSQKTSKKRMSVLVTVFVLLSAFLGSMLVSMRSGQNSGAPQISDAGSVSSAVSQEKSAALAKTAENTTITITYSGQRQSLANSLKAKLVQLGFTNTTVENSGSPDNTSKTFLIFSLKYPESLRAKIQTAVNALFIDVVPQDSNSPQPDVTIQVGQGYE